MSFTYPCPRKLREIMKMSLIQQESQLNIRKIWMEYHMNRPNNISGILDKYKYRHIVLKANQSPMFLLPIHRQNGHFKLVTQWQDNCFLRILRHFENQGYLLLLQLYLQCFLNYCLIKEQCLSEEISYINLQANLRQIVVGKCFNLHILSLKNMNQLILSIIILHYLMKINITKVTNSLMQNLRRNVSKFITTILELYSPLPFELSADLHTINAYLNTYEDSQAYLMEHYIERLQNKIHYKFSTDVHTDHQRRQVQQKMIINQNNKENQSQQLNKNDSNLPLRMCSENSAESIFKESKLYKKAKFQLNQMVQKEVNSKINPTNNDTNHKVNNDKIKTNNDLNNTHNNSKSSLKIKLKPRTSPLILLNQGTSVIKEMMEANTVFLKNQIYLIQGNISENNQI